MEGMSEDGKLPITLIRNIAAFGFIVIFIWLAGGISGVKEISSKSMAFASIEGILAGGVGVIVYYQILHISQVNFAVPLLAAYPLVTVIASHLIKMESLILSRDWPKLVGAVLICLGVAFLVGFQSAVNNG